MENIHESALRHAFDLLLDLNSNGTIERNEIEVLLNLLKSFNKDPSDVDLKQFVFQQHPQMTFHGNDVVKSSDILLF